MREPSVHITKSQFVQILEELEVKAFPVDAFFRLASQRAINTRNILVTNKRTNKKVNKVLLASKGDTQLTADILYAVRIKLHHRGVRKITELNGREWTLCKELTSVCNQFAETYSFETAREAFITYIELGFHRMGGNSRNWLARLIAMSENIFNYYESIQEVKDDDNYSETNRLYQIYNQRIADATGMYERKPLKENPQEHLYFLQLRRLIENNHWNAEDFIDAQFEAMSWCNGIPESSNLANDKAIERYRKYLYKYTTKNSPEPKVTGSIWDLMKNKNG